jgi:ATP-dependent DNA helicase RecQ
MRFGVTHLTDILRGKATDKIKQWNHDQLPTFGVGNDLDEHAWKSVFRQLAAAGLVHVDMAEHGALQLTETAREVQAEQRFDISRYIQPAEPVYQVQPPRPVCGATA